jgi:hypothetical protein
MRSGGQAYAQRPCEERTRHLSFHARQLDNLLSMGRLSPHEQFLLETRRFIALSN